MLRQMRSEPTMPSEAPIDDAARFATELQLPTPTRILSLAEQNHSKLRRDRSTAEERHRAAIAAFHEGAISKEALADIEAEAGKLDEPIAKAAAERNKRRADFSKAAMEAIGPVVLEFESAIRTRINELEEIIRAGLALHNATLDAGLSTHRIIERCPALIDRLRQLRAAMRP